jgi:hypothetical protein
MKLNLSPNVRYKKTNMLLVGSRGKAPGKFALDGEASDKMRELASKDLHPWKMTERTPDHLLYEQLSVGSCSSLAQELAGFSQMSVFASAESCF